MKRYLSLFLAIVMLLSTCSFVMAEGEEYSTTYASVEVTAGEGGKLSIGGTEAKTGDKLTIELNKEIDIAVTADEGYTISSVKIDGTAIASAKGDSASFKHTFTKDSAIEAAFEKKEEVEYHYVDMSAIVDSSTLGKIGDPVPANWFAGDETGKNNGFPLQKTTNGVSTVTLYDDEGTNIGTLGMSFLVPNAGVTDVADSKIITLDKSFSVNLTQKKTNKILVAIAAADSNCTLDVEYTDGTKAQYSTYCYRFATERNTYKFKGARVFGACQSQYDQIGPNADTGLLEKKGSNSYFGFVVYRFDIDATKFPKKLTLSSCTNTEGRRLVVYGIAQECAKDGEVAPPAPTTASLDIEVSEGGKMTVDGKAAANGDKVTVDLNKEVEFAVEADEGYEISSVKVDGSAVASATGKSATFKKVFASDAKISVVFAKEETTVFHYVDMTSVVDSSTMGKIGEATNELWFAGDTTGKDNGFPLKTISETNVPKVTMYDNDGNAIGTKAMPFLVPDAYKAEVADSKIITMDKTFTVDLKRIPTKNLMFAISAHDSNLTIDVEYTDGTTAQYSTYCSRFATERNTNKFKGYAKFGACQSAYDRVGPNADTGVLEKKGNNDYFGFVVYRVAIDEMLAPLKVTLSSSTKTEGRRLVVYGIAQETDKDAEEEPLITETTPHITNLRIEGETRVGKTVTAVYDYKSTNADASTFQ